jgi:arylsulfatase A
MSKDIGEQRNVQAEHPEATARLTALLERCVADGRSTPGTPQQNDAMVDIWRRATKGPGAAGRNP